MSVNDLKIKPLSPDMAEQFTSYLSEMDFSHADHWRFCYCQYYHLECSGEEWRERTAEQNKALAEERKGDRIVKYVIGSFSFLMIAFTFTLGFIARSSRVSNEESGSIRNCFGKAS